MVSSLNNKNNRAALCGAVLFAVTANCYANDKLPLKFVTQDFPPFTYMQEGEVNGPVVDIIRRVCLQIQRDCEIELRPWRRALSHLRQGLYHGAFVMGHNSDRDKWLYFSQPILQTEYGLFVHTSDPLTNYVKPSDLKGYLVAAYGPSNTSHSLKKLAKNNESINIQIRHDDEVGFRQLPLKRVDAVYSNRDVGVAMINRLKLKDIRYAGADRKLSYHVGFSKKSASEQLVDEFNRGYDALVEQGVIKRISQLYSLPESAYRLKIKH